METQHKKDRFLPISILVAALVIAGAFIFSVWYKGSASTEYATAPAAQPTQTAQAAPAINTAVSTLGPRDAILGDANAPVTYVDYGDYQCPFCNRYFAQTEPLIISQYVNTGKMKMIFRDMAFLGPESTAAANAAQCANDQGKLWPYHDALYTAKEADFNKGGGEDDGFYNRALFLKLAQQLNLDMPTFTACVDGNKDAAYVAQEVSAAQGNGVNSTPTFFVDGTEISGAQPFASFQPVIEQAIKAAS